MRQIKRIGAALLALACLAALLPAAHAESRQERQNALIASCYAYFDKGKSVQYDGNTIVSGLARKAGGTTRSTNTCVPEFATPDETLYSVCSDFASQVYWDAFGYLLMGSAGGCWTGALYAVEQDDPMYVYKHTKEQGGSMQAVVKEMLALAEPGDVITGFVDEGGHTMVYVGDVKQDGKRYVMHCWGKGMDVKQGVDQLELPKGEKSDQIVRSYGDANGGAIRLTEADSFLVEKYGLNINLIRPLNGIPEKDYPITERARGRLTYPRLSIDRTASRTRFNAAETGETLTLTIRLKNSSEKAYTLPVTEKVPAGVKLTKTPEGATVAGDTIRWSVELPAGGEKTLTVEYEVTAKRGETILLAGGSVGTIPSNSIPVPVGGRRLTAEENAKLAAVAEGKYDTALASATADTLAETIYRNVLGLNVKLPTPREFVKGVLQEKNISGTLVYVPLEKPDAAVKQAEVPFFHGGLSLWILDPAERASDPRVSYLEPGDIYYWVGNVKTGGNAKSFVYLGDGKFLRKDDKSGKPVQEDKSILIRGFGQKLFYALRPTLAYDDVHTLPALAKPFKFTDVKESDWFYTYVKDLVEDGTVNGMTETTFVPNGTLTYGQALKLIALAVGEKEPAKSGTHWASGWLTLAKSKGWLTEDVNLDGTITRLALCKIAAKAKGLTEQPATNPFKDTSDKDVLALNKAGVINGMTATEFQPNGLLTRAQISKIIWTLRKA